ncbi:MAG: hypothetical protein FLDDKLPJ_01152 [Phycisphaerae bacterium]|nr:hypothetical protein [Phycisphaerae bacterium]
MLVRGGVKDDRRAFEAQEGVHPCAVGHVGDAGADGRLTGLLAQLAIDAEEGVLGLLEEDQALRLKPGDLAAKLGADAAARAGDGDAPAADSRRHLL